jgi:hypothetical protein
VCGVLVGGVCDQAGRRGRPKPVLTGTGKGERGDPAPWRSTLKIPLGEQWKLHSEYFGVFTDGRADETVQHFFSAGAHYLITPDIEIGARFGWGLNQEAPNFFSNIGLGWRF